MVFNTIQLNIYLIQILLIFKIHNSEGGEPLAD
jgi:hypothetical protein